MTEFKKNDAKVINAWAIFDWANSAYALVIATAIFPVYFINSTPELVNVFGIEIQNSALYTLAVSFSYVLIAFLSPILSGIADYGGKRMFFLKTFTIIGSISCISLYFFQGIPDLWIGTSAFVLASIGFAGSLVFYNAYLPEIVTEDRYDRVSAKGYAFGYIGSVILLLFILFMILKPDFFGFEDNSTTPSRIGFVLVGIWWIGFAQITFKYLPKDSKKKMGSQFLKKGYEEVKMVYGKLKHQINTKRFLWSFFFYNSGVQTIIYVATVFAKKELGFGTAELIGIVLVLQLVAIGGAYFFAWVSDKRGNKVSLSTMIIIWIVICICAYFVTGKIFFYFLAAMVGLVMGGIQSLSRSTYSKLIEKNTKDLTSYFSFYDVLYKLSIVAGTFFFALAEFLTGNIRNSILVLAVLFVIGLLILSKVSFNSIRKQVV
jgi:UMF1 family MFS transporter